MTNIEMSLPELAKALRLGASIYSTSAIPVLNNMRLAVERGTAALSFTNMDTWLTTSIPATADAITATTIPAEAFSRIAGAMDGEKLSLAVNGAKVSLGAGRAKMSLPTLPADQFPVVEPERPEAGQAVATASDLAAAITAVSYAVPPDGHQHVEAVRIDAEAGEVAAFDGKRMALDTFGNAGEQLEPFNLPAKSAATLAKLLSEHPKADVRFFATERLAVFECGGWTLRSKLCDPRFPNYAALLGERAADPVQFDPRALERALSRLSLLVNRKTEEVTFALSDDLITLTLAGAVIGDGAEEVPAFYAGGGRSANFRLGFVRDAVRQIQGDTAELHFNQYDGGGQPIIRAVMLQADGKSEAAHFFASYQL